MGSMRIGSDLFECFRDPFEVTSNHRPDTSWRFVDTNGHAHRWYVGDSPATRYDPMAQYSTPTLVWVKDGEAWWDDDDEPHDIGHTECRQCGERIEAGYTADTSPMYVPGVMYCRINGESVREDEFRARYGAASANRDRPHDAILD